MMNSFFQLSAVSCQPSVKTLIELRYFVLNEFIPESFFSFDIAEPIATPMATPIASQVHLIRKPHRLQFRFRRRVRFLIQFALMAVSFRFAP